MADEEKIGFYNPGNNNPVPKKEKDIQFSNGRKTPFQKWTFAIWLLGMIFSIVSICYFFLPFFSALVGIVVFFIVFVIVVFPVVFTLGIILVSEEFRIFAGDIWGIPMWFFDVANHMAELTVYFVYPVSIALFFDFLSIILCSVGISKYKGRYVTYLVFSIIHLIFCTGLAIVYFASGMNVFNV